MWPSLSAPALGTSPHAPSCAAMGWMDGWPDGQPGGGLSKKQQTSSAGAMALPRADASDGFASPKENNLLCDRCLERGWSSPSSRVPPSQHQLLGTRSCVSELTQRYSYLRQLGTRASEQGQVLSALSDPGTQGSPSRACCWRGRAVGLGGGQGAPKAGRHCGHLRRCRPKSRASGSRIQTGPGLPTGGGWEILGLVVEFTGSTCRLPTGGGRLASQGWIPRDATSPLLTLLRVLPGDLADR